MTAVTCEATHVVQTVLSITSWGNQLISDQLLWWTPSQRSAHHFVHSIYREQLCSLFEQNNLLEIRQENALFK